MSPNEERERAETKGATRGKAGSLGATSIAAVALLALWGASWALSGKAMGGWSLAVALGIAAAKGGIVITVFMELARERASARVAIAAGALLVAAMIVLMAADVETRGETGSGGAGGGADGVSVDSRTPIHKGGRITRDPHKTWV